MCECTFMKLPSLVGLGAHAANGYAPVDTGQTPVETREIIIPSKTSNTSRVGGFGTAQLWCGALCCLVVIAAIVGVVVAVVVAGENNAPDMWDMPPQEGGSCLQQGPECTSALAGTKKCYVKLENQPLFGSCSWLNPLTFGNTPTCYDCHCEQMVSRAGLHVKAAFGGKFTYGGYCGCGLGQEGACLFNWEPLISDKPPPPPSWSCNPPTTEPTFIRTADNAGKWLYLPNANKGGLCNTPTKWEPNRTDPTTTPSLGDKYLFHVEDSPVKGYVRFTSQKNQKTYTFGCYTDQSKTTAHNWACCHTDNPSLSGFNMDWRAIDVKWKGESSNSYCGLNLQADLLNTNPQSHGTCDQTRPVPVPGGCIHLSMDDTDNMQADADNSRLWAAWIDFQRP